MSPTPPQVSLAACPCVLRVNSIRERQNLDDEFLIVCCGVVRLFPAGMSWLFGLVDLQWLAVSAIALVSSSSTGSGKGGRAEVQGNSCDWLTGSKRKHLFLMACTVCKQTVTHCLLLP